MARHAIADLANVFHQSLRAPERDRLSPPDLARLRAALTAAGMPLREGAEAEDRLAQVRGMYEPYVHALGSYLLMTLPPWVPPPDAKDNWQTTA